MTFSSSKTLFIDFTEIKQNEQQQKRKLLKHTEKKNKIKNPYKKKQIQKKWILGQGTNQS